MERVAERLTFALPKGRILEQARPLLAAAGFDLEGCFGKGDRRLTVDLPPCGRDPIVRRVLLVKPSDVPTYVEHGVADLGIAGLDTLEEQQRDLYEPLELGLGICRMVIAEPLHRRVDMGRGNRVRVATKYPNVARRHYRRREIEADIIQLYGSVELGPSTGLADQIVDIVESGETLRQNDLVEVETLFEVSSRLVVHPASLRLKSRVVESTIAQIRAFRDRATPRRGAVESSPTTPPVH